MGKTYSGFNENTTKNLLLDAGTIFVNFDTKVDSFETARATKLLGATSGGNKFNAVPSFRQIEVDGVKGKAKSLSILESWEVALETNMLEFKEDTFKHALASMQTTAKTIDGNDYTEIKGKNYISDIDYIDNITYVGTVSGSNEPIIIQIFNALNMEGLEIDFKDGEDIVAAMKFEGHYDSNNLDNPPFAIYYPKQLTDAEKVAKTKTDIQGLSLAWKTDLSTTISDAQVKIATLTLRQGVTVTVAEGLDLNIGKAVVTIKCGTEEDKTIILSV